jgi:hypothetical protein
MALVDHALTVLLILGALAYVAVRTRKAILSARARKDPCSPDCCR